jgi:hypothetical protein
VLSLGSFGHDQIFPSRLKQAITGDIMRRIAIWTEYSTKRYWNTMSLNQSGMCSITIPMQLSYDPKYWNLSITIAATPGPFHRSNVTNWSRLLWQFPPRNQT